MMVDLVNVVLSLVLPPLVEIPIVRNVRRVLNVDLIRNAKLLIKISQVIGICIVIKKVILTRFLT
jgi:hypothetical protein